MRNIEDYMLLSREERRAHLKLNDECSEIGGNSSVEFKAHLAYFLNTRIPSRGEGRKALLCHACNNSKCSNVFHLYWGTARDNVQDAKEAGTWQSAYARTRQKYGDAGMREIAAKAGKASGLAKRKDANEYEQFRTAFDGIDRTKRGWVGKVASKIDCSPTHVYRIARKLSLLS